MTDVGPADATAAASHRGGQTDVGPADATAAASGQTDVGPADATAAASGQTDVGPFGPADKRWWGPRIWRMLHSLAEINDRTDVGPTWRQVLQLTSDVLPCAVCREHFRTNVRRIAFPIGLSNHAELRRALWTIHTATVTTPFPEEQLATEYGGPREEIITRVTNLLSEVVTAFHTHRILDRLHAVSLTVWRRAMMHLIALLRYPQPPARPLARRMPVPNQRRGGNARRY